MADITTAYGKKLRRNIFKCKQSRDRKSRLLWPNQQPEPTDQQKADWKAALASCLLKSSQTSMDLHQRLGKWIRPPNLAWKFYYYQEKKQLWCSSHNRWLVHDYLKSNRLSVSFHPEGSMTQQTLPLKACQRDVNKDWKIVYRYIDFPQVTAPSAQSTFRDSILHLPSFQKRLLYNVKMSPASESRLTRHLQLGLKCNVGKDGSLIDSAASYAWSLHLQRAPRTIPWETVCCAGPVDGEAKEGEQLHTSRTFRNSFVDELFRGIHQISSNFMQSQQKASYAFGATVKFLSAESSTSAL